MKSLKASVLTVCILLTGLCSFAQGEKAPVTEPDYNKPKLFNDLPQRININPANYLFLLQSHSGQTVTIPVQTGISFQGLVVSTSDGSDPAVKSVVIKLLSRQDARLVFTQITQADNSIKYIGRIFSLNHGDSFEIAYENGQYYFSKKGLYDLFNE
jgi:hypothetical protein